MRKLVIDRNIWLRGEGNEDSYLLRDIDGKLCCLGVYLESCGVPRQKLGGVPSPAELANLYGVEVLPEEARWLVQPRDRPDPKKQWTGTTLAASLMEENDLDFSFSSTEMKENEELKRESLIRGYFKALDIEVEFIN